MPADNEQDALADMQVDPLEFTVPVTPGSAVHLKLRLTPKAMGMAPHVDSFGSTEVDIGGTLFVVEAGRTHVTH